MIETIDFAVGWPVVEENDLFLSILGAECNARNMRFRIFTEQDLPNAIERIKKGSLRVKLFLDMASNINDPQDMFAHVIYHLKDKGAYIVDDPDEIKSAADKSIMHFKLLNARIPVPYTIVIRRWDPSLRLSAAEKRKLGTRFVIKPALGYGQRGVKIVSSEKPLKDIADARLFDPGDNFLLQEFINPIILKGRPAWFRVYSLFGEIIPCWWNPESHEFYPVTLQELYDYQLMPVVKISSEISKIVKVDWFSCEIAISDKDRNFYAIDYVNDQCAIYPKSLHKDGVPDSTIINIAERLVEKAWLYKRGKSDTNYTAVWLPKA